ncbi:hypothetical protein GJ744_003255 [Endocarpon pusillum]|uniref:Rhodopsin domain-containing protein n=1 Tax=Endocarpon pusillum TaxID=364733 RepID=A0A8H7DYB9_9EURO|nr:hypothetical protein GJ744_003255 [Endocarpon pusillum]
MKELNDLGYATLVAAILFAVLAAAAVLVRLWTRSLLKAGLGADDWWIIAGLVAYFGFTANAIYTILVNGGGQDYEDPRYMYTNLSRYLKAEYMIGPVYALTVTLIQISIIFLYRRLFTVRGFQIASMVVGVACFVWMVVAIVGGFLYCIPMQSFWDPLIKGHCFNYHAWFLSMEIIEVLFDVVILCLPLMMIERLHLSMRKGVVLLCLFLLGGFVVITGIVRIVYVYQPKKRYSSFTEASLWSSIHLGTAVICACLPTYRPLLDRIVSIASPVRRMYASLLATRASSKTDPKSTSTDTTLRNGRSSYRCIERSHSHDIHLVNVSIDAGSADFNKGNDFIFDKGITVRHDVEVV